MNPSLEVRLLGPFEVLTCGRLANVSGGKRRALLALLALRGGRVVGVDSLIDALWADDLPAAPRNAVQHHVARLRAALGSDSIAATPDGYALADAVVDATQFDDLLREAREAQRTGDVASAAESIARGLELWRGPALHGLTDTAWFDAEAQRLESLRVDALEEQFETALALGEHRDVVHALRAALETNPFRERLWGQLMLALYRCGRQPDALEAFREARRVFSEELALEPGPELRRLQDAILAQDPAIAPAPSARRRRGALPAPSTSFVDRAETLDAVLALVREHRVVTLTGPPGVGKSRLALEAARAVQGELADGAWFVDLARAGGEDDVVRLVAHAVDARGADPLARVVDRLRDADAILWLDGCSRVVTEAARVVAAVVAGCPDVRVLATSREVLHVPGEVRVTVEPLPGPAPGESESPAVQLFVERARAARPGFDLAAEDAPVVAEISRRVDGLPLAIELAAARAHALRPAEILSLVEHRLEFLGDRATSDDHRAALGTLVEWSYDLLHADEKSLLHHVAVHRGGGALPSLVAAAASDGLEQPTVTYLLGVLVDRSILSVSFGADDARYDMLETVREYALGRLAENGRLAAARRAHAEAFATLAEAARAELRGADWRAWVRRLELENDNLWAALTYARDAGDSGIAARLAPLAWYFVLAERVTEGRRFVQLALAAAAGTVPHAERLELDALRCFLATEELDLGAAIEIGERALALEPPEDVESALPEVGLVEVALGLAVAEAGDVARGAALTGLGRARLDVGDNPWARTAASLLRAQVAATAGDVATVAAMAADAHRHAEATGFDAFLVPAALLEAWVAEQRGDSGAATASYGRALDLAGRAGFADHTAFALSGLASGALAGGDPSRAEELERRALATAEATHEGWAAAHARVGLGRVLAAAGDVETAATLYRNVLAWSAAPRVHGPRESLFVVLAGDPAAAAAAGLVGLGDAVDPGGRPGTAGGSDGRAEVAIAASPA